MAMSQSSASVTEVVLDFSNEQYQPKSFLTNISFKGDILKEQTSSLNLSLSHAMAREQMQQDYGAAQTPISRVTGTECNAQLDNVKSAVQCLVKG